MQFSELERGFGGGAPNAVAGAHAPDYSPLSPFGGTGGRGDRGHPSQTKETFYTSRSISMKYLKNWDVRYYYRATTI